MENFTAAVPGTVSRAGPADARGWLHATKGVPGQGGALGLQLHAKTVEVRGTASPDRTGNVCPSDLLVHPCKARCLWSRAGPGAASADLARLSPCPCCAHAPCYSLWPRRDCTVAEPPVQDGKPGVEAQCVTQSMQERRGPLPGQPVSRAHLHPASGFPAYDPLEQRESTPSHTLRPEEHCSKVSV